MTKHLINIKKKTIMIHIVGNMMMIIKNNKFVIHLKIILNNLRMRKIKQNKNINKNFKMFMYLTLTQIVINYVSIFYLEYIIKNEIQYR